MTDTDTNNALNSSFILNREYFAECFDETAKPAVGLKTYTKAILLTVGAGIFFTIENELSVEWFLLALAGVELLSIRYRRSWWIARQMISRASGRKVDIRIDDQGIFTDNTFQQKNIPWGDITEIKCTDKGFIVIHNQGTSYLSKSGHEKAFVEFLDQKAKAMI